MQHLDLFINLNNKAPNTVKYILSALPFEGSVQHGRDISFGVPPGSELKRENNTGIVSKLDVGYWCDWNGSGAQLEEAPGREAITLYYGPEQLSYHGGLLTVNVFGRVDYQCKEALEEIGLRIWR